MSYCRFTEGDVYAYDSCEGGVRFYVSGGRRNLDRLCRTYNEAYWYMKELRDKHGLDVPDYAVEALKEDATEEAKTYFGPDGVVAEILDENAKLRELVADMWFWHYEGHIDSESQERQMLHIDAVIQRMRELGVEVDG